MQSPTPSQWVSQRAAADHFGISERTLTRLRNGSTDYGCHRPAVLTPGVHWRRISAFARGRVQYNLEALEAAINERSARSIAGLEVAE
jgi:hypothetical protein